MHLSTLRHGRCISTPRVSWRTVTFCGDEFWSRCAFFSRTARICTVSCDTLATFSVRDVVYFKPYTACSHFYPGSQQELNSTAGRGEREKRPEQTLSHCLLPLHRKLLEYKSHVHIVVKTGIYIFFQLWIFLAILKVLLRTAMLANVWSIGTAAQEVFSVLWAKTYTFISSLVTSENM